MLRLITAPSIRKLLRDKSIWVDLFSILPYFITLAFNDNESLEILKVVYVLRLYRAFEAFRFSYVLQVFIQTITGSIRELLLLLFICSILVISFGALAYYAEHKANTDGFENIPASFWWSLITMTTVGYGDVSPTTVGGKIVGCACAITGVLLLALPTSIVTTNFSLYNAYAKAKMKLPPRKKTQVVSQALKSVQLRSREGLRSSMNSPTNYSALPKTGLEVTFPGSALNSAGAVASPRTRRQAISPLALELDNIAVTTRPQTNGLNHVARRRSSYS
ncbi:potassium voltage-gated channel subfamily C member 1-like [Paramuricea clavata]|uniref:Potassium voltage-gated channel subfamily C member 1-like n=1 Tax=Paramuricea clavata TaxID=317549 RepID=A0A6S7G2K0_PARCT|nr:potassium voltage-gated channel subfamily C member 1-like [Paramuricea clavata]